MDGGVQSVRRALHILRLLAEERGTLGVTEIVRETGLPQATVHRLLATLVDQGWVERSRYTARYRFGPGILGTTAVALAHAPLLERGRPVLARLAATFGLDAYLSARVGRRVVFLERAAAGERNDGFHPGIRQPAHCTAAGKALLAFLPATEFQELYRDRPLLRRYTTRTIVEREALEQELQAVREAGCAEDRGEFAERWRSIAAPVRSADGRVIAALSCGGSVARMTHEQTTALRGELLLQAEELSHQLGLSEE